MNVHVIGRPGSDYRKMIDEWLGRVPLNQASVVFNYGLQGGRLENYLDRHPGIRNLPNLNMYQFGNKFESVMAVREAGMSAPMSWKYRYRADMDVHRVNELIVKPYYSLGGRNIHAIDSVDDITEEERRTHYIQERIKDRRYELRVICASWIDPKEWRFMKRVHDNGDAELAWNHHNGGRFQTVENPSDPLFSRVREDVKKMLPLFGYQFGAADFIIQNNPGGNLKHFFIEWNLAPGWSIERTEQWYKYCFEQLQKQTLEQIECYEHGLLLEDTAPNNEEYGANPYTFENVRRYIPIDLGIEDDRPDVPIPPPDWDSFIDVDNNEGYVQTPDHILYQEMGAVVIDTPMNLDAIITSQLLGKYRSITCSLGHRLLVLKGDYTAGCPACGDELTINI